VKRLGIAFKFVFRFEVGGIPVMFISMDKQSILCPKSENVRSSISSMNQADLSAK
jgi:hypothetical protein